MNIKSTFNKVAQTIEYSEAAEKASKRISDF